MDELSESSPIEAAAAADDPGTGTTVEPGESGPAQVTDQPQGAGGSLLQEAGDIAGKAETDGSAVLQTAGDVAGKAETDGSTVLHTAGDIAGKAEADSSTVLHTAGDIAGKAETDGSAVLQTAGDIAGRAEADGSAVLHEAEQVVAELDQADNGDASQSTGDIVGQFAADAGQFEADAGQVLSETEWNPGAPPEIGDSGPASPVEQSNEQSDVITVTAIGIVEIGPAEPGEFGPAAAQVAGGMERAMAQVDAAMATGEFARMEQGQLTGIADATAQDSATAASSASFFSWAEASGQRADQNLPSADQSSGKGPTR